MSKIPDGRKSLPNEWFIDRAKKLQPDNEWPMVDDFSDIRDMTPEERKRSIERERINSMFGTSKCVSCGTVSTGDFCEFCLREE